MKWVLNVKQLFLTCSYLQSDQILFVMSVLALLDFSSAVDTIDYSILVHRLHADFGFTDTVHQWFSSYLTDRTHYISLYNHCSALLLYTHVFLNVQFLAPSFSPCILSLCLPLLTHTISCTIHFLMTVIDWATANMLKLKDNWTKSMLVTSKRSNHLHSRPSSITIGNAQFPFKQSVIIFGLTLDCHLTMNAHVSNIARTCYIELRRLVSIRGFMISRATAILVSAFVLSGIGYCSSLICGSTHDVTSHLQRMQNYAARVILRLPKSSNITTHLKSLHWLPVKVRSTYKKRVCLCYHCQSSTAPSYVIDMLHIGPSHTRNTRSNS